MQRNPSADLGRKPLLGAHEQRIPSADLGTSAQEQCTSLTPSVGTSTIKKVIKREFLSTAVA